MIGFRVAAGALAAGAVFVWCAGCVEQSRPAPLPASVRVERVDEGTALTVTGKIRDIAPAVVRSLPLVDLATPSVQHEPEAGRIAYELVGLRGEPGTLVFEFEPTGGVLSEQRVSRTIRVTCRIGRFGDPDRETILIEQAARELIDLDKTP